MPELPEVETVRRDLEKVLVGRKITAVKILDNKIVGNKPAVFALELNGQKIIGIERRGKLLAFKLNSGKYLLAHMKMTGQLIYTPLSLRAKRGNLVAGGHQVGKNDLQVPNKFTRVIINFGGGILYFNDLRRFGYLKVVSSEEKENIFKNNFGIEPLTSDFEFGAFEKLFKNRKTSVKAMLLNQKLIAGLGNIYVDESCHAANILPWRLAGELKKGEINKLFVAIESVIEVAVKNRGTTFKDFVDGEGSKGYNAEFLKVFNRAKEQCRQCKTVIKKIKHAGRGTHYCEKCQK